MRRLVLSCLAFWGISIELFSFEKGIIETYRFENNRIEMCSLNEVSIELFSFLGD